MLAAVLCGCAQLVQKLFEVVLSTFNLGQLYDIVYWGYIWGVSGRPFAASNLSGMVIFGFGGMCFFISRWFHVVPPSFDLGHIWGALFWCLPGPLQQIICLAGAIQYSVWPACSYQIGLRWYFWMFDRTHFFSPLLRPPRAKRSSGAPAVIHICIWEVILWMPLCSNIGTLFVWSKGSGLPDYQYRKILALLQSCFNHFSLVSFICDPCITYIVFMTELFKALWSPVARSKKKLLFEKTGLSTVHMIINRHIHNVILCFFYWFFTLMWNDKRQ